METLRLIPHPDHPPRAVTAIEARVLGVDVHWLRLRWRIEGTEALSVPSFAGKGRADGLWKTTCFELFLRPEGALGYVEINLSPSERWAAYEFTAYRDGMAERPMPRDSMCTLRRGNAMAMFDAEIPIAGLPTLPWDIGISAVIEEQGGVKSYWALAHPPGKADFHHDACFAATLAPPSDA